MRNKTKKRYESYLAELEAAETKRVATLEGIVRAKALSVAVSATYVPYFYSFLIFNLQLVFGRTAVRLVTTEIFVSYYFYLNLYAIL